MHLATTCQPLRVLLLAFLSIAAFAAPAPAERLETPRRIELPPLPGYTRRIGPDHLIAAGDRILFTAYDPRLGEELWQSDGTVAGTRLVADFCPGPCSSYAKVFGQLGDRTLFSALNGGAWVLYSLRGDLVEAVTRVPGEIVETAFFGGYLYAVASRPYSDFKLYRSNGSPGSWELFEDLCEPDLNVPYCRAPDLFPHQGNLYYLHQAELRKITADSQVIPLRDLTDAADFVALSDQVVLFRGYEQGSYRLFTSDGTFEGTHPVSAEPANQLVADPGNLVNWRGRVYFTNGDGQLVRTDGTIFGTQAAAELHQGLFRNTIFAASPDTLYYLVVDQWPALALRAHHADGSDVELANGETLDLRALGLFGGKLLIDTGEDRLLLTDGTAAGTTTFAGLSVNANGPATAELAGSLYVAADRNSYVDGLWRLEAGGSATRIDTPIPVTDGTFTPFPLGPESLLAASSADDGTLFRIDPDTWGVSQIDLEGARPVASSGSTLLVRRVATPLSPYTFYRVTPDTVEATGLTGYYDFVPSGDGLFFFAGTTPGQRLMVTDGSPAGIRELFDAAPGWTPRPCNRHCEPAFPNSITVSGDHVFFVASPGPGEEGLALWVYDRADGTTRRLRMVEGYDPPLVAFGRGKAAFFIRYEENNRGIWVTDGTVAGTRRAFEPPENLHYEVPVFQTSVGERFFYDMHPLFDRLWVGDGGPASTQVLLGPDLLKLGESAAVGDQLFFTAGDLEHGDELWVTDGTAAGTRVIDIRPGPESSLPKGLRAVGNRLVFAADDGVHGDEPFVSDGSAAGTLLVADLAPGRTGSSPKSFAASGERLYFEADDGQGPRSLWAVDLPAAPLPPCPDDRLCLAGGRFEVAINAQVGATAFPGRRTRSSAESGVFSFFGPDNWEAMIKVLDGCAINQRFWVYAGAATDLPYRLEVKDRATGEIRSWSSPSGRAEPILDGDAFATCGAAAPAAAHVPVLPLGEPAPRCPEAPDSFCFDGGRFVAHVEWQTANAGGVAHTEPYGSRDSGLFTFFSTTNWELMVKVLDGCAINGRHWVYVAGTTDVGWHLTVEDRTTGTVRHYRNTNGVASPAITDGDAFTCP